MITLLSGMSLIMLVSDVNDSSWLSWLIKAIIIKGLGVILGFVAYRLTLVWHKSNKIPLISIMLKEEL